MPDAENPTPGILGDLSVLFLFTAPEPLELTLPVVIATGTVLFAMTALMAAVTGFVADAAEGMAAAEFATLF